MIWNWLGFCFPLIWLFGGMGVMGYIIDRHFDRLEQQERGVLRAPQHGKRKARRAVKHLGEVSPHCYPVPKRQRIVFGDELDDFICRRD